MIKRQLRETRGGNNKQTQHHVRKKKWKRLVTCFHFIFQTLKTRLINLVKFPTFSLQYTLYYNLLPHARIYK